MAAGRKRKGARGKTAGKRTNPAKPAKSAAKQAAKAPPKKKQQKKKKAASARTRRRSPAATVVAAASPSKPAPVPTSPVKIAPAAAARPPAPPRPPAQFARRDIEALHALPCSLGELDLHLFNEGRHRRLWQVLGCHPRRVNGAAGATFVAWAPNAQGVSVVGDFCAWDAGRFPMRPLGASGLWELFVPDVQPGDLYKYAVLGHDGVQRYKADPFAFKHEQWPGTASIVQRLDHHGWGDGAWMNARAHKDPRRAPMSIYELHLSSWRRVPEQDNRPLDYRELAPQLVEHCLRLGFTHVEFMPVMEHPFGGSWGYQVTGFFAPTSRHGTPDDFRFLVDALHQAGLGVILDWVPAHFPDDEHGLLRWDGTALYEHEDPRLGVHPDWNTRVFNLGRNEVRGFLIASALYWLRELHADGLRVDAVASMLYRDYSRADGEWLPNKYGGREYLEAIDFLRELTTVVREECPGTALIAEESTAWPGVTDAPERGGLGFTFKWNMGWMHDTLAYFAKDPVHRKWHHDRITFAMLYEHSECFINPLSHDEVVHGKGSLLNKMPGDEWQKLANLRTLFAYQYLRPGKKLLFMGAELAPWSEWDHDASLPWHLAQDPPRAGLMRCLGDLGHLYRRHACLWRGDPDPAGFQWIDCRDGAQSVLAFLRWSDDEHLATVLNLTPVPRPSYRIGVPRAGRYECIFNSDAGVYGGSDHLTRDSVATEAVPFHGFPQSIALVLPPLSALVLQPS